MSNPIRTTSGWKAFWERGGWWRAALVTVVYALVFLGISFVTSTLFATSIDKENLFADTSSVFFGLALPILLGGVLLAIFVWSVGWWPSLFARQPLKGRRWMWIAVILVLIPILLRLFATNWSSYSVAVVLTVLFLGLCVGFTEELLTRGIAVNLLRRGGYSERVVMVLSSVLFGVLHSTNVVSGQPLGTVAITVVYAFGFGAMMYLSMRVTGSLVWAMLLHAATDPTTFLATGGIDTHGADSGAAGLLGVAGIFNILYIVFALLAIFLVRDRINATSTMKK